MSHATADLLLLHSRPCKSTYSQGAPVGTHNQTAWTDPEVAIGISQVAHQPFELGLKETAFASQLRCASRAIVAESEHRSARDAPVSFGFDSVQPTGPQ